MFDTKNHNCAFAEQTVAFLYGELETENRTAFDAHLQICAACADELQSFGAVRASINDWCALEFDSLSTPVVEFASQKRIQNIVAVSLKSESWRDGLRKIFSPAPAFAFAAALLLVTVCAGLIVYNFGGGNQIADKQNREDSPLMNSSASEKNTNQTPEIASEANKKFAVEPVIESSEANKKPSPQNTTERGIIKISNDARLAASKESVAQKTFKPANNRKSFDSTATVAQNVSPVKRRTAPKLSSIEDEEDEAVLRLSDLLDDAGGK